MSGARWCGMTQATIDPKASVAADMPDGWIRWLETVDNGDIALVGGKNASLGELIQQLGAAGVRVPPGFAVTADAYRHLIDRGGLFGEMYATLAGLADGTLPLAEVGDTIRAMLVEAELPPGLSAAIRAAYRTLGQRIGTPNPAVAVRSSATAEDLPDASFAGQQESFLNIRGEGALIDACRHCYASLFTDRAIAYRQAKGFDHLKVALSIGVQQMIRSDMAGSGVIFTLDPETGFPRVVSISAAWGLGEPVVQGTVDPDTYLVFKPLLGDPARHPIIERRAGSKTTKLIYATGGSARTRLVKTRPVERRTLVLTDDEILTLARWACVVEDHYQRPMDLEWAKDGDTGALFIVQARPETVHAARKVATLRSWKLEPAGATPLVIGAAVGNAIATGSAALILDPRDIEQFPDGAVLVTAMTDPDWVPLMRRASGIVTDHGGPTSHAAIVARELGVPAVVGTTSATTLVRGGETITLSCADGDVGRVYRGTVPFRATDIALDSLPQTRTALMLNLANPASAFTWWRLPARGVGLARMEFIIDTLIGIHPMALIHPDRVTDTSDRRAIAGLLAGAGDSIAWFVDRLACGIARLAAAFHPHPAIVRLSDFKSNEYSHLIGGAAFESIEENPMLGLRGAARYCHPTYRDAFALECRAIRRVREDMGFANVIVMVPFCRTPNEADAVLRAMAEHGLRRGDDGFKVYVMAEIPANIIRADEFAARFDGFSIGSNDLTQLTLGVDRDSAVLASLFDERDPAVTRLITDLIDRAHAAGKTVGLCGQAPSDHPDFARFLVERGIDSISLNPDSFAAALQAVAAAEAAAG
jgi:pyruvate,water dikinase